MKKNKIKSLLATSSLVATALPLGVFFACSAPNKRNLIFYKGIKSNLNDRKVVAQSFEPIDFLASFGKKPDFFTLRSDQGVYLEAMPKYLKDNQILKNSLKSTPKKIETKIYDWSSKQSFNPASMLKNHLSNSKGVLLTYQSLHVANEQIKQAFDGVVYDDLGNDSMLGSYAPNPKIKLGSNYNQPRMYDVIKNYKLFAKSLDSLYGGDTYKNKAEVNSKKFSSFIQAFSKENKELTNKTILFVRPNKKVNDQSSANDIAIWTPLAYNLFYGDALHNGLGMLFPQPKNKNWPKSTKEGGYFDPWAINTRNNETANVAAKVVEEYSGTADIVVYLQNEKAWSNKTEYAKKLINNNSSNVFKLLKAGKDKKNIYFADYSLFYRGMYGLIGQQEVIKKISNDPLFKMAASIENIKLPNENGITLPQTLKRLSEN